MGDEQISEALPYPSKYVDIDGAKLHYFEVGEGDPILFLHGIPTSGYIWRNVIPYLSSLGRCVTPDLIGLGLSDKPDIDYSVFDHVRYIELFIEKLNLKNLTLIMHGWGSVIGLHYAMHHEENCNGLVFYEAFLRSVNNHDLSLPFQEQLLALQNLGNVSELTMNGIAFVDKIIPQTAMRELTEVEMERYRAPFLDEGAEKPILQYLKELPNGSGKTIVDEIIADYSDWLMHTSLPKLLLYSVPGFITTIATVIWAKDNLPNLEISGIGEEMHLAQESHPRLVGETISAWLQGVEQRNVTRSKKR